MTTIVSPAETAHVVPEWKWRASLALQRRCRAQLGYLACSYCGRQCSKRSVTLDHIIPQALGGSDDAQNLTLCCRECNASKGHKSPQEWAQTLRRQLRAVRRLARSRRPGLIAGLLMAVPLLKRVGSICFTTAERW